MGKYGKEFDIVFWMAIIGMAVVVIIICVQKIFKIYG